MQPLTSQPSQLHQHGQPKQPKQPQQPGRGPAANAKGSGKPGDRPTSGATPQAHQQSAGSASDAPASQQAQAQAQSNHPTSVTQSPQQELRDSHEVKEAARAPQEAAPSDQALIQARDSLTESQRLDSEHKQLQQQVESAEKDEKELNSAIQRVDQLEGQLRDVAARCEQTRTGQADLQRQIDLLEAQANPRQAGKIRQLRSRFDEGQNRLQQLETEQRQLRSDLEEQKLKVSRLRSKTPGQLAYLKVREDFAAYRKGGHLLDHAELKLRQEEGGYEEALRRDGHGLDGIAFNLRHLNSDQLTRGWPDLTRSGLPRSEMERRLHSLQFKMEQLLPAIATPRRA